MQNLQSYTDSQPKYEQKENRLTSEKCYVCKTDSNVYQFSCEHYSCLNCIFNYFISSNFVGLELEGIILTCPFCSKGNAVVDNEQWIEAINQLIQSKPHNKLIYEKISQRSPINQDFLRSNKQKNNNKNSQNYKICNVHEGQNCLSYCKKCQKFLCNKCISEFHEKFFSEHKVISIDEFNLGNNVDNEGNNEDFYKTQKIRNDNDFNQFEQQYISLHKLLETKEKYFYDKIENDYIIKTQKTKELIDQLNKLQEKYLTQMQIFHDNIQKVFLIIDMSYYYFYCTENTELEKKNKKLMPLTSELLDISFLNPKISPINEGISHLSKDITESKIFEEKALFDFKILWNNFEYKQFFEYSFDNNEEHSTKEIKNKKNKIIEDEKLQSNGVTKLLMIGDSNQMALGTINGGLNLFDLNSQSIIVEFSGHKSSIWSLCKTSRKMLVSGSSDKSLKIWDIQNNQTNPISTLRGHKGTILCITELEKDILISGSEDKTIRIWNIQNISPFNIEKKNKAICTKILYEPNKAKICCLMTIDKGYYMLTGNDDNKIKIWDMTKDNPDVVNIMEGHDCTVWSIIKIYEEELIASAGSDNVIIVWNLTIGSPIFRLEGHLNTISSLVLLKSGLLLSSSWDGTSRLWNLTSRKCIGIIGNNNRNQNGDLNDPNYIKEEYSKINKSNSNNKSLEYNRFNEIDNDNVNVIWDIVEGPDGVIITGEGNGKIIGWKKSERDELVGGNKEI